MTRSRSGVLALFATLLAAACSPAGSGASAAPPAGSSASASPAAAHLEVSYSNLVADNLPLWIAKEQGILARHGLDVNPQLIASTTGIPALLSGQTQIAQVGGSETVAADVEGGDLVIVGTLTPYLPYVLEVPSGIKTVEDLKGKKLGIAGVGGSIDVGLRLLLKKLNLNPDKDVFIQNTGSVQNAFTALMNGTVSGTLLHPPDNLEADKKGFHALYDLTQLKIPAANVSLVVKRAYLNANKDVVQRYVDSIVEAIALQRKDKTTAVAVLKKYFKSDDDAAMGATYDFYVKVVPPLPFPAPEQLGPGLDALVDRNPKAKGFDVKTIQDTSFVQSAADRGLDKK